MTAPGPTPVAPTPPPRRRALAPAAFALGLLLLAAAAYAVWRDHESLSDALAHLRTAPPSLLAAILLLPIANWLFTAAVFWILSSRYARIPFTEMAALIAVGWVLNMLPFRPGLLGRVAYHRARHNLRIRDSAKVLAVAMATTALAALALIGTLCLAGDSPTPAAVALAALAPPVVALSLAALLRAKPLPARLDEFLGWLAWLAVAARCVDVLVWGLRYWLIFRILDIPVSPLHAALIAAASQWISAVPIQIGAREWAVGLAFASIPRNQAATTGTGPGLVSAATPGLFADLLNRAVEIGVLLPVGLLAGIWLFGLRSGRRTTSGPDREGSLGG